jgi:predicted metal-dependent hydrolase
MDDCEVMLDPRAREGVLLFNEGRYFEAHEALEAAWREEQGRLRQLYQGILEAGVVYLHLRRNNLRGALKVYGRCMRWLEDWPEVCRGTHVGQLRRDLEAAAAEARRLGPAKLGEMSKAFFKPIIWSGG